MKEALLEKLAPYGQEHLLQFWDRLDDAQRRALAAEIDDVDVAAISRLYKEGGSHEDVAAVVSRATPPPAFRLNSPGRFTPTEARARGAEALAAGQVGVMVVAGGQGTRLGFDHPKGMFPIGPVSKHTLFQIHAEKVLAASRRYGVRIPFYVMTSPATDAETREFLAAQQRFGLAEEDVRVFCQGTMPAVDEATGKILLDRPDHLALNPDGHGGMLAALSRSGALDDARRRGIEHLFYFQVDNPLVDICGPEFLGYHLLSNSEMSSQVVAKKDPLDRVGNVVRVDGRLRVIEYSDLPDQFARERNEDGSLAIWAGSIAIHAIRIDFLARMAAQPDSLPLHVAHKRVPHVDAQGQRVEPEKPNAIKFERFIFDLLPSAAGAIVVEVDPRQNFAPLKNAPGAASDTPEAVRAAISALHADWLRRAGAKVSDGATIEISPLFALDAEEVASKIQPGYQVESPTYLKG